MPPTGPATWPLGALALGVAVVAAVLSLTYFLSPLAYPAAAVALGRAIAGVVTVLDPACVVIGGGVAAAGDEWWMPLRAACRGEVVPVLRDLELLPAALGPEAAILGAARTVFDEARVRVR